MKLADAFTGSVKALKGCDVRAGEARGAARIHALGFTFSAARPGLF
jgi:hypothetical protein